MDVAKTGASASSILHERVFFVYGLSLLQRELKKKEITFINEKLVGFVSPQRHIQCHGHL